MNPIVKSVGIKNGLILAGISIGYYLIAYLFNEELFANFLIGIALWVVFFVIMLFSVIKVKKEQDGYISYKDAVGSFTIPWIVNALLSIVFSLLLFHVIDPELGARVNDLIAESTVSMMEKFGAPEEAIEQSIAEIQNQDQFSIGKIFSGNLTSIVFAAIVGLIVAAFFKKDKPVFEDTVD